MIKERSRDESRNAASRGQHWWKTSLWGITSTDVPAAFSCSPHSPHFHPEPDTVGKRRRKLADCPNCGTALEPQFEFCPTCGQENHELKVPFRHLAFEFFEGITHFDTKFWNTLKALATPGRLTQEFLAGRRARYVPLGRLYLFVSVVFLFLLGRSMDASMRHQMESGMVGVQNDSASSPPRTGVRVQGSDDLDVEYSFQLTDSMHEALYGRVDHMSDEQLDSVLMVMPAERNWFNRHLLVAVAHIPNDNDGAFHYLSSLVTRSFSYLMFILMPFTALLLEFIFARKRYYYEHLVFSVHVHTAFFLIGIIWVLLVWVGVPQAIKTVFVLAGLIYSLTALKRVYGKSWGATIGLYIVMAIPYLIAFVALFAAGIMFGFLLF